MNKRKAGFFISMGASLQQPKSFLLQRLTFMWIAAGLCACSGTSLPVVSTPQTECPPPSYNVNIYRPTPLPTVSTTVLPPTVVNTLPADQPNLSQKQLTFLDLRREVERWTAVNSIDLGDTSQARIVVTFLSPELLRAASVIDLLDENPNNPYMYAQAASMLDEIAGREKLLFFLTAFQVRTNGEPVNVHTLDMDAKQLILINASGLQIEPAYYDHNLDQPITMPQYINGYLYYPLAVDYKETCTEVLDSTFDTKIILQLPRIVIDGKPTGPHTWTIQYTYLLNTGNNSFGTDNQRVPADLDIHARENPPESAEISDVFWEQYAMFLWSKLTPEHK